MANTITNAIIGLATYATVATTSLGCSNYNSVSTNANYTNAPATIEQIVATPTIENNTTNIESIITTIPTNALPANASPNTSQGNIYFDLLGLAIFSGIFGYGFKWALAGSNQVISIEEHCKPKYALYQQKTSYDYDPKKCKTTYGKW